MKINCPSKVCRGCGAEKPLSEYYVHRAMADGHLNKCKDCVKSRVKMHREENLESVMEYDRNRPNKRERTKKQCIANKHRREIGCPVFKEQERKRHKNYTTKYPEKKKATCAVNNAIRDGRLIKPSKCEHCGKEKKVQGHHHSYKEEYWLDVIWLCAKCHAEEHVRLRKEGVDPDV